MPASERLQEARQTAFDLSTERGATRFIANVLEAQENGFEQIYPCCGQGFHDDSDYHDLFCLNYDDAEAERQMQAGRG